MSLIREASLALLKEGNNRYAEGKARHPNEDAERRSITVTEGQRPFATVLGCSDSRNPVELVFDRGVGDLFVIRVAGNIVDDTQLGTIEYGVDHLGTPLLVVLGHTGCGAVTAACQGGELPGHLPALISRIQPAVARARASGAHPNRLLSAAIEANVWQQIEEIIQKSVIVREHLKSGAVQIVGGVYDLQKGAVNWLGSHPRQQELVSKSETGHPPALNGSLGATPEPLDRATQHLLANPYAAAPAAGKGASAPPQPGFPASLLPAHDVKARAPAATEPAHSAPHPH